MVKEWFKRASKPAKAARSSSSAKQRGHTIDELVVLERYDEAEERLRARLKNSDDVHARLKLAEVLIQLRRGTEAVEEFLRVSELYSRDGFQDKAAAVLRKASKIDPANEGLRQRLARIEDAKALERTRKLAVEALKEASRTQSGRFATAAIELEQMWDRLATTEFVKSLPPDQMKRLLANTEIMRLPTGSRLATRGEDKPEMYLIAGGEVEATSASDKGRVTLRSFSAGHLLGDRALLEHKVWAADYTASRASSALRLTRTGLEQALVGNPDPRALLDGLRQQRNDHALAEAIEKLGRGA